MCFQTLSVYLIFIVLLYPATAFSQPEDDRRDPGESTTVRDPKVSVQEGLNRFFRAVGFNRNFQVNAYFCLDVFDDFGSDCTGNRSNLYEFRWISPSDPGSNGYSPAQGMFGYSPTYRFHRSMPRRRNTEPGDVSAGGAIFVDGSNSVPKPYPSVREIKEEPEVKTASKTSQDSQQAFDLFTNGSSAFTFELALGQPLPNQFLDELFDLNFFLGAGFGWARPGSPPDPTITSYTTIAKKYHYPALTMGSTLFYRTKGFDRFSLNLQFRTHVFFPGHIDFIDITPSAQPAASDFMHHKTVFIMNVFFGAGLLL